MGIWGKGDLGNRGFWEKKILGKGYFGISGFRKRNFEKSRFWEKRILGKEDFGKR